jgi:hypothetical protein
MVVKPLWGLNLQRWLSNNVKTAILKTKRVRLLTAMIQSLVVIKRPSNYQYTALCRCVFVRKLEGAGLVDFIRGGPSVHLPVQITTGVYVSTLSSAVMSFYIPRSPLPPPANFSPNTVGRSPGAMQLHDRSHTSPVLMPQCDPCPHCW